MRNNFRSSGRSIAALTATVMIAVSVAALHVFSPSPVTAAGGRVPKRAAPEPVLRVPVYGARQERRAASRYVKQEEVVNFPRLGAVRVRAVEVPGRLPRLEFASAKTGRRLLSVAVGTSDPKAFVREPGDSLINPLVRFRVLRGTGLTDPLIFAVAVRPGGSDHGFETTLVAEAGGRLKPLALRPQPINNLQGGVFVGDLGGGRGHGLAVWSFIWEDGPHYGRHRYGVSLYPFDARRATFGSRRRLESKGAHDSGEGALEELGLPRYRNLLDDFPAIADYRN
jgi:hypothetical protein